MINLQVHLGSPVHCAAFLLLILAAAAWAWLCFRYDRLAWVTLPFLLLALLCAVFWAACCVADMDEIGNLHRAWLLVHGQMPYRDFWDHHPPLLLLVLAPLVQLFDGSPWLLEIARALFALLFLLIAAVGWRLVRRVWREHASPLMYLLVLLSACTLWHFAYPKADPLMILLLLLTVLFTLDLAAGRLRACFFAGLVTTLALSFTFKQYPLALLPPLIILVLFRFRSLGRLALYALGLALGLAPLLGFLLYHGLLQDFLRWNGAYNADHVVASADFSLVLAALAALGCWFLLRRWQAGRDRDALVFLAAFLLSSGASLFVFNISMQYYLGFWFVLVAILAGGLGLERWAETIRRHRLAAALVAGLVLAWLVFPMFYNAYCQLDARLAHPPQDRQARALLARICRDDTCLALTPFHPICARDATRLYAAWQYWFLAQWPALRDDLARQNAGDRVAMLRPGLAAQILRRPPALIAHDVDGRDLFDGLRAADVISADDLVALRTLLERQYVLETIGDGQFYVRRDKDAICH